MRRRQLAYLCAAVIAAVALGPIAALAQSTGTTGIEGSPAPAGRVMQGYRSSTGTATAVQLDAGGRVPVLTTPAAGVLQAVNLTQVLSAAHSATNPVQVRLTDGAGNIVPALTGQLPAALVGGRLDVTVGASVLPTGAATEATLSTLATQATAAAISGKLPAALGAQLAAASLSVVPATGATFPISAASLPLPAGAATEVTLGTLATQVTVSSIDAKLPAALVGGRLSVDVGASALPSGAATDVTLSAINTKIPASPSTDRTTAVGPFSVRVTDGAAFISIATDRTTAASPFSNRLSDGAAFYDAAKTGQLPAALVGGRLDVNVDNTATVTGTVTANAGAGTFGVDQTDTATADYDSGAPTVNQTMMGIALPGAAGAVAGGTSAAPLRTDPTGTTAQPVTDGAGSLTVDPGVGMGIPLATESTTYRITPKTSNGATPVELLIGTAIQVIYPTTIVCTNESTTDDEVVEILTATGPTVMLRYYLGAKGTMWFDGRGDVRTDASDALQFRLADASVLVKCSGSAVKR